VVECMDRKVHLRGRYDNCDPTEAIMSKCSRSAAVHVNIHASAAMTLDVYADLFEDDLDTVAESVAKMWPRHVLSQ
jgi:hypothetical protein